MKKVWRIWLASSGSMMIIDMIMSYIYPVHGAESWLFLTVVFLSCIAVWTAIFIGEKR